MTRGLEAWTPGTGRPGDLASRLFATRRHSLDLAAPLSPEDQMVQPNDDASPTKWHLAHVTWFFETFVLKPHLPDYKLFDERFPYCFNSYYEAAGARHPRGRRGLLTRPSHDEVMAYRAYIDEHLAKLVASDLVEDRRLKVLLEIGINHEQQHQELLLTDILSVFASQPLTPAYRADPPPRGDAVPEMTFTAGEDGIVEIGHTGDSYFFDNERPRHRALLQPHAIADRLVTNGEWLAFMQDGGYRTAAHWLADGWAAVKTQGWDAPLYWEPREEGSSESWLQMGLYGLQPVDPSAPVTNISYYEADAYARWAGKRLPTEFEWEHAAVGEPVVEAQHVAPVAAASGDRQLYGQVWQWTQSAYLAFPGYRAEPGALGEYNGKFMCGQHVLRGSSCATPPGHARATYRNFFYPHQRWQFTGLRLASDR
jgi:ergothioneine biosynthesis protein EgtB